MNTNEKQLFIFIDESGNFDFSKIGTRHFLLTATVTTTPFRIADELNKLKYSLLIEGTFDTTGSFHASEDKQAVRNAVFDFIESIPDLSICSIIVDKEKYYSTNKVLPEGFYFTVCNRLIVAVMQNELDINNYERIVMIIGSLMSFKQRELINKSLKQSLKRVFKKTFSIHFIKSSTDLNCQIVDYCSWAIYVKEERAELRPYEKIKNKIIREVRYPYT
jgi:hypothetical protein